jgi:hypothetical protein
MNYLPRIAVAFLAQSAVSYQTLLYISISACLPLPGIVKALAKCLSHWLSPLPHNLKAVQLIRKE